jgi:ergothioneine biosynthesis protein EgtB
MREAQTSQQLQNYLSVRQQTEALCRPLETEDYVIQSMPDVSPAKWHLGHTTWFFETFLLQKYQHGYKPYREAYGFLFNSYYETIGERWARSNRGLLSRPTVREVYTYRASVDERMRELMESSALDSNFDFLLELGLNHEQQHEELLVTDIKNVLALNPLKPVYDPQTVRSGEDAAINRWLQFAGGLVEIGFTGAGFSFDNERPRHRVWLNDFSLQNRLVTNGEYLEFIKDGGYSDFRHWLSDGWALVQQESWKSPMYWENQDGEWHMMTLSGFRPLDLYEPVCHVSYYEADACAKWAGKRLPSEAEWEHAASSVGDQEDSGNFLDTGNFHPVPSGTDNRLDLLLQMFGDVWEWTQSAYLPYPGFQPEPGAVGEYNGKFMSDQMVLRGGSCATPRNHIRKTYRNFFQCDKRWQFTGIRLASDE